MWTFWRCFWGERLRSASSFALSSQSGRRARVEAAPATGGRNPGRLGGAAVGAGVGRTNSVSAVPTSVLWRRGAGGAGRPLGFCNCMSSPGAMGLRMPAGIPGRPGAAGRLLLGVPGPALSRRIGLPTSSKGVTPGRPGPGEGRPPGAAGRLPPAPALTGAGAPGRCGRDEGGAGRTEGGAGRADGGAGRAAGGAGRTEGGGGGLTEGAAAVMTGDAGLFPTATGGLPAGWGRPTSWGRLPPLTDGGRPGEAVVRGPGLAVPARWMPSGRGEEGRGGR